MAIQGALLADFESFYNAVQKAEVHLRSFETGAGKVEKSLNRMVDNFSGRQLIQDATIMAQAVEKVGGVSKLTEVELRKIGGTASEAAAKLRVMGQDIPPGIQKIVDQTKHLNTSQSNLIGTLKNVAGAFGIAFSVQALTRFIGSVFDAASNIHDMSQKLGISAEAAQRFKFAADQTGSSLESVERAINNMNKGLASADKGTVKALRDAGLEFSTIRNMKPEDAFAAIAEAVRQIPDPMKQAEVASQLFGRAALDLLPGIKEGFIGIGNQATVMSNETVRSLERAQDAWEQLGGAVTIVTGTMIADMMQLPNVIKSVATSWEKLTEFIKLSATLSPQAAYHFAAMGTAAKKAAGDIKLVPDVIEKTAEQLAAEERAAAKAQAAMEKWKAAVEELAGATAGFGTTLASINGDVVEAVKFYLTAGVSQATLAEAYQLTNVQVKAIAKSLEVENTILRLNATATGFAADAVKGFGRDVSDTIQELKAYMAGVTTVNARIAEIEGHTRDAGFGIEGFIDNLGDLGREAKAQAPHIKTFSEKLGEAFSDVADILDHIPGKFAEIGAVAARTGKAILANLAKGDMWGAIIAGATGVITIFGKLFGPSEISKVRKLREEFDKVGSDLHTLERDLRVAGLSHLLADAFNATRVKEFEAAVLRAKTELDKYQKTLELGKSTWEELKEVMKKYGITIHQLGDAFRNSMLTEQAQGLFREWQLLAGAGVDLTVIARQMKDALLDYVRLAMKMGVEIPLEWKPLLQSLIDQGLWLDANGNAYETLEDTGVTFATTVSQALKGVEAAIREMIDALMVFLGITKYQKPDWSGWTPPPAPSPGGDPEYPGPSPDAPEKIPTPKPPSGGWRLPESSGTLATLQAPASLATPSAPAVVEMAMLREEIAAMRRDAEFLWPGLQANATTVALVKAGIRR